MHSVWPLCMPLCIPTKLHPKLQSQVYRSVNIHRPARGINFSSTSNGSSWIAAQRQELLESATIETQKKHVKNLFPVIDFTREELKPGTSCWVSTGQEVVHALETYGCFEAVYDKEIPIELQNTLYTALDQLFELPVETKSRIIEDNPLFGYTPPSGRSTLTLYEGIGLMNAANLEGTQKFTDKLWPDGNDFFCKTVLSYSKKVAELEQKLMQMVFESYGVDNYAQTHKPQTKYLFRMAKYRVPNSTDDNNVGIGTHTDKTFVTILGQHQVGGLLVRSTNDRQWTIIEPSTSSHVVLAGDALTAWSNGRIKAPFHKVLMEGNKERYSLGLFSLHKGMVEVPKELVDEEHPLKFKPFNNMEFMEYYYSNLNNYKLLTIETYCGV